MKNRRVILGVLLTALLAAAGAETASAQLQPIQPPQVILQGTAHHVKGVAVKGSCNMTSLTNNISLVVKEYWYATSSTQGGGNLTAVADPLTFNSLPLTQGKVLGSATPDASGNFDVTWSEVSTAASVPWVLNATNTRTGARLTVYRVLWLEARSNVANMVGSVKDLPLIQFFNAETTKNVGTVTVNCVAFG